MKTVYLRPFFLLCAGLLIVGCGLLSEEEPDSLPLVEPTLIRNTPTPISLPTLEPKWGQELPVNQYGFSFRPVSIYNVSYQADGVSMVARDAESNIGPRFFLTGGRPEEFESNEKINVLVTFEDGDVVKEALATLVDKFVPQLYSVVGHPRPITLNLGSEGLQISGQEVDFSVFGQEPFRGRITVLKKTDNQLFIMVGMSPLAQWDYQIEPLHDAILEQLTLFEPVETP
ncbi:MAG: hypothetical protein ACPGWR_29450 [Ardenticatenaceae bacterium]